MSLMEPIKLPDEQWMKIQAFLRACPQVKVGSALCRSGAVGCAQWHPMATAACRVGEMEQRLQTLCALV